MGEMRRGTLRDFDAGTYVAVVEIDGSVATYVSVPTSLAIASADMTAGSSVAVWFFDPANPDDAVLLAVWG
jgi:hypothetical protein